MSQARGGRVGVLGGGLGGLAAACTLAARGYDVVLLERNAWLGGKAAVLEGDGFRFDMGPTILTLPSVLARILAEAGRTLQEELDLVRLDPQWRSFFADGSTLDLVADPLQMHQRLDAFAPGSGDGYERFLDLSKSLHELSERYFFWRSVGSLRDLLSWKALFRPSVLAEVVRMRPGRTVAETVRAHAPDARVAQMLEHFTQYVGSAPDASPAVLCGIAHMQTDEGVWYPRGGTAAVPQALERLARELGVEIHTGTGVRRILRAGDGGVAGVETEGGERIELAAVVSNVDAVRTHRELLPGAAATRFERRSYEPACSGVVLYLGLERGYDQLLHHNFVFSRDPHAEFEAIYRRGEPAEDPTCYVCAPTRTDPTVAPPGGEALYVLVHTPYLRSRHDWEKLFPTYRQTILKKLADTAGLDDLAGRLRFEGRLTPEDIHRRYGVLQGAIYGLASHGRFTGAFKPANRSPDVPRLYLAGGAAHPGPGMPMVLMSGWIAADALDRDGVVRRSGVRARGWESVGAHEGSARRPTAPVLVRRERDELPRRSPWLMRWFTRYARRYLRRHFHAVRLARVGRPPALGDGPLLVVLNHPSWWDPLLCLILTELFPDRAHYAPIDQTALGRYRFIERFGLFGVEPGTPRGARTFLRVGRAILSRPATALWVTAQGRFTDPRRRPLELRRGVGHLLQEADRVVVLPLALEYPFWDERLPEALARFGEPLPIERGRERTSADWLAAIEERLTATQDALARDAQERNPAAFDVLVSGRAGVGGVYDWWRSLRAWLRGERFHPEHGSPSREIVPSLAPKLRTAIE